MPLNSSALIQTIGRAARHIDGHAIMYANAVTASMRRAIDETYRRREIRAAYNHEHNITPQGIRKAIRDITERVKEVAEDRSSHSIRSQFSRDDLFRVIKDLEHQMRQTAKSLEFEKAALLRNEIVELKKVLIIGDEHSAIAKP